MSTTTPTPTTTAEGDGLQSGDVQSGDLRSGNSPPTDKKQSANSDRLYRVVWRWHFYAGMIIAPVLIVVSATGALYIFKDELAAIVYPGVTYVEPSAQRVTYDQQLAVARAAVPASYRVVLMQVFSNPKRATSFAIAGSKFQYDYVDPYRGIHLGSIESGGFFDIVLNLHRTLLQGTKGRIAIELTTCWTIVLAATGIYLWWPAKANQVWGVWLPRLRRKPYVVLRDLHSVAGIYVAILMIVIAFTGLIYTYVWGKGFQYAGQKTDAYDMFSKPMISKSPPEAPDVSMDRIVETAKEKLPGDSFTVWFPRAPNAVFLVTANPDHGPQVSRFLFLDRATGEVLEDRPVMQTKPVYWLGVWNYALHAGTVYGMPSKILWLVTCIILITSPITGVWMWWERRPRGRTGLPARIEARRPRWVIATVAATSVLLPALGISVLMFILGDQLVARLQKRWARRRQARAS